MTKETRRTVPSPTRLPGDRPLADDIAQMVRVDHAGEFGAARIYEGQLAILGDRHPKAATIRHMRAQEERHLERFDDMILERGVRPTLLSPIWDAAGYALGAATALMGPRAAMACTAAVEEVIDGHYAQQAETLGESDPELKTTIEEFRADELEHRDTAYSHGAADAPGYPVLSSVIKTGCRFAIALSKRI